MKIFENGERTRPACIGGRLVRQIIRREAHRIAPEAGALPEIKK
jgi:hypothetical protein